MTTTIEGPAVERRFRPDIEGLRAIAVVLVVAFHARVPGFAGGFVGVDVFFVVSGFLITGLITAERESTGRISLSEFWARRIRRLLPAATLVLIATVLLARAFLPPLATKNIGKEVASAALYASNLLFARRGTDYFAEGEAPSVVQHYWSLSTEEQFYMVWPVLLLVVTLRARRLRRRLGALFVAVVAISLPLCIAVTAVRQPWAFFTLPTRAWELAIGALLSLLVARLGRIPPIAAAALGWAGIAAIVAAGTAYDAGTLFPGVAALLPVLGAAAVIVGCTPEPRGGPETLLKTAPFVVLGRLSYSLYLWHWPLLIIAEGAAGEPLAALPRAGVVAGTVLLAYLTYRLVENPVRTWPALIESRFRTYALGAAVTAAAVVIGLTVTVPPLDAGVPAASATEDEVPSDLRPSLLQASADAPLVYRNGCHAEFDTTRPPACEFGSRRPGAPVVALLGDSHAAQWFPALQSVAEARGWRLATFTKSACPAVDVDVRVAALRRPYRECGQFRTAAYARMRELGVSLVVMSSNHEYTLLERGDFGDAWEAGMRRTFANLPPSAAVAVIGDTPRQAHHVPVCLSEHLRSARDCETPRTRAVDEHHRALERRVATAADATFVDPTDWVCPEPSCAVIEDGVLMYRDSNHITTTFSRRLQVVLGAALPEPPS